MTASEDRSPLPPAASSIRECLDRLEALLGEPVPLFSRPRRAARDAEARALLHRLREALDGDASASARAQAEAEGIVRQAQDEARRIVVEAQEYARRALAGEGPARAAGVAGRDLREQAARDAEAVRREADAYALGVLERLEAEVGRILATIRRGKAVLANRPDEPQDAPEGNGRIVPREGITEAGRGGRAVRPGV